MEDITLFPCICFAVYEILRVFPTNLIDNSIEKVIYFIHVDLSGIVQVVNTIQDRIHITIIALIAYYCFSILFFHMRTTICLEAFGI